MTPARAYLRQQTAAAHKALDAEMSGLALGQRDDLARFLSVHHIALTQISDAGPKTCALDLAHLLDCLRSDLAHLRAPLPERRDVLRSFRGNAEGVAYVLAGSHFGNGQLRAEWSKQSDPAVRGAGAYLTTDALKLAWPGVLARLSCLTTVNLADARDAAIWTFDVFRAAARAQLAQASNGKAILVGNRPS